MADQVAEGLLSPYLRRKRFAVVSGYLRGRVLDFGCGSGALAALVDPDHYVGVYLDTVSLLQARSSFPTYCFVKELPSHSEKFDLIVALAVIEHVSDPALFLRTLAVYFRDTSSRLVGTTPHPSADWIHDIGAAIGIFSKHANEEHQNLLDRPKLEMAGDQASLQLLFYQRFLFGMNQLALYARGDL